MPSSPTSATTALGICTIQFIRAILCGNVILKSTFTTFLQTQIAAADLEIAILGSQIARLDLLNEFAMLEIQTLAAVQNKIQASLNVVLGPMQSYATCPTISTFIQQAESGATLKALAGLQNLIYTYNRRAFLATQISNQVKQLQNFVGTANAFLNLIAQVCNS